MKKFDEEYNKLLESVDDSTPILKQIYHKSLEIDSLLKGLNPNDPRQGDIIRKVLFYTNKLRNL